MSVPVKLLPTRASSAFRLSAGSVAITALAGFAAASLVVGVAAPVRDGAGSPPERRLDLPNAICSAPAQTPVSRFKLGYLEFEDEIVPVASR